MAELILKARRIGVPEGSNGKTHMTTHSPKIPFKIIFLLLAQALLFAGSAPNEPLLENIKYLYNSINRSGIAHIPNNETNKTSLRKPLEGYDRVVKVINGGSNVSIKQCRTYLKAVPLKTKLNYKSVLGKNLNRFNINKASGKSIKIEYYFAQIFQTPGDPNLKAMAINQLLDRQQITSENILDVLDKLTIVSKDAGNASSGVLWTIDTILKTAQVNSRNLISVLNSLVEPFKNISQATHIANSIAFRITRLTLSEETGGLIDNIKKIEKVFSDIENKFKNQPRISRVLVYNYLWWRMNNELSLDGAKHEIDKYYNKYKERTPIELVRSLPTLVDISIQNAGNSKNDSHRFIDTLFRTSPFLRIERPDDLPVFKAEGPTAIESVTLEKLAREACMSGSLRFEKALGRRLVFIDNEGNRLEIKLLKKEEGIGSLEPENYMAEYSRKHIAQDLKKKPPAPLIINGNRCFRFAFDKLGESIKGDIIKALNEAIKQARKKSPGFAIDERYIAVADKVEKDSQNTEYINDNETEKGFKDSALITAHDIGEYARHGLVHTALIDIFHNLNISARRYCWYIDFDDEQEEAGAGRLTAWRSACLFPNIGKDGSIRDFAEFRHIEDAAKGSSLLGSDMAFITEDFKDKASSVIMMGYLGEYAMALGLEYGDWLIEHGLMPSWQDEQSLRGIASFMKDVYFTIAASCIGLDPEHAEDFKERYRGLIDWQRFARQMAFWMTPKDYIPYVKPGVYNRQKNFPTEAIFGKKVDVTFGEYRPGTFDEEIGFEGDDSETLFTKEAPALGPVNGPFLIQELITANFYIMGFAVIESIISQQYGMGEERKDQAILQQNRGIEQNL